jgi:type I thyroxine 5'-deiodinase
MDSNEEQGVCYAQPVTFEDRVRIASDFVHRCDYEIPLVIDRIDNAANEVYAGWPERLYVIDSDGTIAYKGQTGPFGYHPEEVAAWLLKRFPPEVRAPSEISAERMARDPLAIRALEWSASRERWRLKIDRADRVTVGRDKDAKSFDLGAERAGELRRNLAELRLFAWKEAHGEPRVEGRTRSLSISVGDSQKVVHVYDSGGEPSEGARPRDPEPASDLDRFDRLWEFLHHLDS